MALWVSPGIVQDILTYAAHTSGALISIELLVWLDSLHPLFTICEYFEVHFVCEGPVALAS